MPCYNGLYTIIDVDEKHLTITLDLPNSPNICPTFHTSEILPYIESDTTLFPSHHFKEPDPIETDVGDKEFYIECILNAWRCGHSFQYLI